MSGNVTATQYVGEERGPGGIWMSEEMGVGVSVFAL